MIAEGEFDALLLAQELRRAPGLPGWAAVVTLGSAAGKPEPKILVDLMPAAPWFLALDGDEAGDKSASGWPSRAIRVRPPGSFKDWTEAAQAGVNLRRFWSDRIGQAAGMPHGDEPEWYAIEERQAIQNEPPWPLLRSAELGAKKLGGAVGDNLGAGLGT